MNEREYLLTCLAEECNETAHRVSKALRFGLHEVQPGQGLTNAERIVEEYRDLFSVMCVLVIMGVFKKDAIVVHEDIVEEKVKKILENGEISVREKTLSPGSLWNDYRNRRGK